MVVSGRSDIGIGGGVNEDNLPSFSDSEDYIDDISNEGYFICNHNLSFNKIIIDY